MNRQKEKRDVDLQSPITSRITRSKTKKKIAYEISSKEEYEIHEVEKILAKRTYKYKVQYLLKWKRFPESSNSWENKSNLNCPDLIKEFENDLKKKKAESKKREQKTRKENIKEKENDDDYVPSRKNLKNFRTAHANNSQKDSLNDKKITVDHKKEKTERPTDSRKKSARIKNIELKTSKANEKINYNNTRLNCRIKNVEVNEREIIKKRHIDSREKSAKIKNAELKKPKVHEKGYHNDTRLNYQIKNVAVNEHEIIKKRHIDSQIKSARIKNAKEEKPKVNEERYHNGSSQKKSKVAQSNKRNKQIPKFQNLQYYVKSASFPTERKNGMLSVMGVSFQGTDVLKGLEHFVRAGIAVGPLPDFLYDNPIRTGASEFQFTVS